MKKTKLKCVKKDNPNNLRANLFTEGKVYEFDPTIGIKTDFEDCVLCVKTTEELVRKTNTTWQVVKEVEPILKRGQTFIIEEDDGRKELVEVMEVLNQNKEQYYLLKVEKRA